MPKAVQIIGIPIDLGQSHRGVDLGPGAIRYAGLASRLEQLGYEVHDAGNLPAPVRESLSHEQDDHYLSSIKEVCEGARIAGAKAIEDGFIPIFLGGHRIINKCTIPGITQHAPAGILWVDAHGDFHTVDSSLSGNIHGMPLALLLGRGYPELVAIGGAGATLRPEDVVMVGVRDLDEGERQDLSQSGVTIYTMRDIDEKGIGVVAAEAIEKLGHHSRLHVSLDIDALDPQDSPGAGTLVPGGLTYREAQLLMEIVADSRKLSSLDIVEINPILDSRNKTAQTAVELTASLFGKRII
jgi:arginase